MEDIMPPEYQDLSAQPPPAVLPPAEEQPQPADAAVLPPPAQLSWRNRVGSIIPTGELRVGGAALHPSHIVAAFGNARCRVVFCTMCGGSTQGSFSPLLAVTCRKNGNQTSMRQVNRMLHRGKWPTEALAQEHGQGLLSPALQFARHPSGHFIALAGAPRSTSGRS